MDVEQKHPLLPIIVDLDGTLVLTDTLHETVAQLLFKNPLGLLAAFWTLSKGRLQFKEKIADLSEDLAQMPPMRSDLVGWLSDQAAIGHEIHLCSASHHRMVQAQAQRIDLFTSAIGSSSENLKGRAKASYLTDRFPEGFIYCGDSSADLEVWQVARGAVIAGASTTVAESVRRMNTPVLAQFQNSPARLMDWLKAIRIHHWPKNALMFVPLVLAHQWGEPAVVLDFLLAFLSVVMVTSATYLLNDIADLSADRQHWSKGRRPFASGRLTVMTGFLAAFLGLVAGFGLASLVDFEFTGILAGYLVMTSAYSMGLKRIPIFDTLVIAVLFATRLAMGAALLEGPQPAWLLTFALFFFFSLALGSGLVLVS